MRRIIFVCECNICRSPMAEFIFKNMTADIGDLQITSVGLSGEKCGQDMTDGAKACLAAHGVPFESRRAVLFDAKDYQNADLIVCMDEWNKLNLEIRCLNDPEKKIFKLLYFARSVEGLSNDDAMLYTNVSDPYYSGNYEKTFAELSEGCVKLKRFLWALNVE